MLGVRDDQNNPARPLPRHEAACAPQAAARPGFEVSPLFPGRSGPERAAARRLDERRVGLCGRLVSSIKRALVVEDDPDIVELIDHYLKPEGFEVESVADGRRALERVRAGSFSLLILDLQLPGLDGLSVCAELRRLASIDAVRISHDLRSDATIVLDHAIKAVNGDLRKTKEMILGRCLDIRT